MSGAAVDPQTRPRPQTRTHPRPEALGEPDGSGPIGGRTLGSRVLGSRVLARVAGPRFVDAPIRAFALVLALWGFLPGAWDSTEPLYLLLQFGSCALIVAAMFAPLRFGFAAAALFLVFLFAYPDYLNPFQTPLEASILVVLSALRWRWALVLALLELAVTAVSWVRAPELPPSLLNLVTGWMLVALLALSAAFLESRIRREIERSAALARAHEREMQQLRLGFAIDAHDTVSHDLAMQAAAIKVTAFQTSDAGMKRRLGELALMNSETQRRLRGLLSRLSDAGRNEQGAVSFSAELRRAVEAMCAAGEAGGIFIEVEYGELPETLPAETAAQAMLISRELVTNMVKHAAGERRGRIWIGLEASDGHPRLCFASSNAIEAVPEAEPRSLVTRAHRLAGSCEVESDGAEYRVAVQVPLAR